MPQPIEVVAERRVAAAPERVLALLWDYQQRGRFLPENYLDYRVEQGGTGPGTQVSYRLRAARRERAYRLRVETSGTDGLVERDLGSSLVTTWRVEPADGGAASLVRLTTRWQGGGGVGGFFERTFAPRGLRRIYADLLDRLAAVAQG